MQRSLRFAILISLFSVYSVNGCLRMFGSNDEAQTITSAPTQEKKVSSKAQQHPGTASDNDTATMNNRTRRAAAEYKPGDGKLWKMPIQYTIDPTVSENLKKLIADSIAYLQERTCIEFKKIDTADHLKFTPAKGKCSSFYGEQGGPQNLFVSDDGAEGCGSLPMMLHEIMHTLGIEHEMKRTDRDKFVEVNKNNVQNMEQFDVDDKLYRKGYPYDISSVMQYDSKFLRKNNNDPTLQVKKDGLQFYVDRVVKTYAKPSFYDIRMLNDLYGCSKKCGDQECQNEGYKAGKACTCQCPKGVKGAACEAIETPCGQVMGGATGKIETPKMGSSLMDPTKVEKECSWLVPATHDQIVHVSFFDRFQSEDFDSGYSNFIEIRSSGITLPGLRFFGAKDQTKMAYAIPGPAFIEMGLKNTNGYGLGFSAAYSVLSLNDYKKCNHKVCYNGGEMKADCSCTCMKGFTGANCENFENAACAARKLPCLNRGVLDITSKDCQCKCPVDDTMAAPLAGDQCQNFGYCHQRLDPTVVNSVAPKAVTEAATCKAIKQCDGSFEMKAKCPITCQTQCECINAMELKKPGVCAAQLAQCDGGPTKDAKKKVFMAVLCQKACNACPTKN